MTISLVETFCLLFFFFKQKTAYDMPIRDWSSDVCSSDLHRILGFRAIAEDGEGGSKQALVVARGNVPHRSRIARGDKRRQSCVIQRTVVVIAMYHGDHSYSPVLASHWMPGAGRRFPTNMIMVP